MALVSGLRDIPTDQDTIAFGEIGLSGEIRTVPRVEARINEAARLGFTKCILPKASLKQISHRPAMMELIGVSTLTEALSYIR
jgi:DNA repair protein RadA/Sms